MKENPDVEVTFGSDVVTIKRKGVTNLTVAQILGKIVKDDKECIYLDRLVHKPSEEAFGSIKVHGAISTILTRPVPIASMAQ